MAARRPSKPAPRSPRAPRQPRARLRVATVLLVFALACGGLAVRAFDLQVLHNGFLKEQGDARALRTLPIRVSRGTIFDRNGVPLAVSTPVTSLWVDPGRLLEHADRIPELATALGLDGHTLEVRLRKYRGREFLYLRRRMIPADARKVLALDVPGVYQQREYKRFYPSGEVTAQLVGFTNIDDKGVAGLEHTYDTWLTGRDGSKKVIRDRMGHAVENVAMVREPEPGKDLYLSIDRRIQYLAYRSLKASVLEHGARAGSVVVMDVRNGEVLALVNQPSFNPNAMNESSAADRRNRAVTDLVEPGSVLKPFTIAAALESGKWQPHTPVDTNPGWLRMAGYTIHDVHNHGLLDVTGVLTESSNVGAAEISQTLDSRDMYGLLARFGFGERSGSGFPGEAAGVLPPPNQWTPIRKATISYGYGISATPLQLARAYAALANDGKLHTPSFVRGQHDEGEAVLDPQIAHELVRMLETVVSPAGTALRAAIANYRVAGKTGTSHIAVDGGYSDRYVSAFVGMAPASNPRLVVVVVIDDPSEGTYYGGLVAAPLFSKVMGNALRLLDVPPDNVRHWYVGSPLSDTPISSASAPPDYAAGQANYREGGAP